MILTNASIMFTAFLLSTVSVVIVFVAGATSGVVRMNTLLTRSFFAFFMTGAATYFLLMLFDWYYEKQHKKFDPDKVDAESKVEGVEVKINADAQPSQPQPAAAPQPEQPAAQPAQPTFQPMNLGQ